MKVEFECATCVFHRGYEEILEATNDPAIQFKAISGLLQLLAKEFKPTAVPAYLGTDRDRLIRKITGNADPYSEKKRMSNQKALETLPFAEDIVAHESTLKARFRKACLSSIVGNIMEFGIPTHRFRFEDIRKLIRQAEQELAIDEISKIYQAAKRASETLYLTDNAGEIAFDRLLVQQLKDLDNHVVVAVKDGPVLNDATLEDAKSVGLHEIADDVITTGTDAVGLVPEESSDKFLNTYNSAEFVIAKGMGHAETLSELRLKAPHALLLRTKCRPVANFLAVQKEKNVATMMP